VSKPPSGRRHRPWPGWNDLTPEQKIEFLFSECDRLREDRNEYKQMYINLLREVVDVQHEHPEPQTPEDQG
jgi:hypothetical protein